MAPLVKTSGLADVVGALPCARHEASKRALIPAIERSRRCVSERPLLSTISSAVRGFAARLGDVEFTPFRATSMREGSLSGPDKPIIRQCLRSRARGPAHKSASALERFHPDVSMRMWQAALASPALRGSPRPATITSQRRNPGPISQRQWSRCDYASVQASAARNCSAIGFSNGPAACRLCVVSPSYRGDQTRNSSRPKALAPAPSGSGILVRLNVWDRDGCASDALITGYRRARTKAALTPAAARRSDAFLIGVVMLSWQKSLDLLSRSAAADERQTQLRSAWRKILKPASRRRDGASLRVRRPYRLANSRI
jgi:hypothetical protein